MKLRYLLFLLLLIISNNIKAQVKTVIVVSQSNNGLVPNVLVYHKTDIIGETDKFGKVVLRLNDIDTLTFVKNGFQDFTLAKNTLNNTVKIIANEGILLNEVKISPINAEILLNNVAKFMKSIDENGVQKQQSNYGLTQNIQVYNKFMANNDTLHYLNNRFTVEKSIFKINYQNKLVKKFKVIKSNENIYRSYSWGGMSANFPISSERTPLGIYSSVEFTNFFYHQNLFEYKIEQDDKYYKLIFKQKKKSSLFNIEGYLIIDKFDYGIYEFESKLLENKPFFEKNINFSNNKMLVFKILTETYHFKYFKQNDKYLLDNCNKSTTFMMDSGEFKNILFYSAVQVEKTIDFEDKNLMKFNMYNWDMK